MDNLDALRTRARSMLDITAPRDALTAYYALYHDPARTELFTVGTAAKTEAFLAVCQTGWELFRQIAVLRATKPESAELVLRRGLKPNRPYYLVTTHELHAVADAAMEIERIEVSRVYRMDMERYAPDINVLVAPIRSEDGRMRFVIRSQGEVAAEAGINWQSSHFAEVYVWTVAAARGRGWGKAVVEACVAWLVRSGVQPVYIAPETNFVSIRLAESVGFVDTGAREYGVKGLAIDWDGEEGDQGDEVRDEGDEGELR